MKTPSTFANLLSLLLVLFSMNGISQTAHPSVNKPNLTTLQNLVEGIKEKNASLKNAENVTVMVNDMLIENLDNFTIDPKSIKQVEVLVLKPNAKGERINPSIIINTKQIAYGN